MTAELEELREGTVKPLTQELTSPTKCTWWLILRLVAVKSPAVQRVFWTEECWVEQGTLFSMLFC